MITIRPIESHEINYINQRYQEIEFKLSDPLNEYIILAELDGKPAGQGRLVYLGSDEAELGGIYVYPEFRGKGVAEKIVSHLVKNSQSVRLLYCLPFEHLGSFYKSFGFEEYKGPVNHEIKTKLEWCLSKYPSRTLLLVMNKKGPQ